MNLTPDQLNALFEAGGAYFTWRNAYQLYKDKTLKGVYWLSWFFFAGWGLWNLFYYPGLGQMYSFYAGIALVSGNLVWCALALKYKALPKRENHVSSVDVILALQEAFLKTGAETISVTVKGETYSLGYESLRLRLTVSALKPEGAPDLPIIVADGEGNTLAVDMKDIEVSTPV